MHSVLQRGGAVGGAAPSTQQANLVVRTCRWCPWLHNITYQTYTITCAPHTTWAGPVALTASSRAGGGWQGVAYLRLLEGLHRPGEQHR
eukprot:7931045-Pyramimonas_sp.AAC.1